MKESFFSSIRRFRYSVSLVILLTVLLVVNRRIVYAQADAINWDPPVNLSDTETRSAEPFVLGDPTGRAHVFWSENIGGDPGDFQSAGNSLMYSVWNGEGWSQPVDVVLSPNGGVAYQPHAAVDENGVIHLIWIGDFPQTLYYSSAHASEAGRARSWKEPIALDREITGVEFSISIGYEAPDVIHIAYAHGSSWPQYEAPREVRYLRSSDRGVTWDQPVKLAGILNPDRGASNTRLLYVPPGKIFVSWTEWNTSGNGQAIRIARSLDHGRSWKEPQLMAVRRPDDYEVDWLKLAELGEDRMVAVWEGGNLAFRNAMYSMDEGETWSAPVEILTDLIGETGYSQLVRDSAGHTHLFVAQRGRGSQGQITFRTTGLWHSVWDGARWSEPVLAGEIQPVLYPSAAVISGNRVVTGFYNSGLGDVLVMIGTIPGAPPVEPSPWPSVTADPFAALSPTSLPTLEHAATSMPLSAFASTAPDTRTSPGLAIWIGILPIAIMLGAILVVRGELRRR